MEGMTGLFQGCWVCSPSLFTSASDVIPGHQRPCVTCVSMTKQNQPDKSILAGRSAYMNINGVQERTAEVTGVGGVREGEGMQINSNHVAFTPNYRLESRTCGLQQFPLSSTLPCAVFLGCFQVSAMILDPGSRPFLLRHICGVRLWCFLPSSISPPPIPPP